MLLQNLFHIFVVCWKERILSPELKRAWIVPYKICSYTGCFNTLVSPSTAKLMVHIFRTLYQFQITMQVFRPIAQFTYFGSYGLCVKVEHIFMNIFWLYFWGDFPKMAMESSIIDPNVSIHWSKFKKWLMFFL